MPRKPANKLSIYLIKPEYTDFNVVLKNANLLKVKNIDGIGSFYYGDHHTYEPTWVKKFFTGYLNDLGLLNSSSKGVLLLEAGKDSKKRTFAIAFGYGWQYLNHGVYEERFGLKAALNIIDPTKLRKIDKKNMAAAPKDSSEQLTKSGVAADFGIDIEQDLIRSITGQTKEPEKFGKSATGKDSLTLSVQVSLTEIKNFLSECLERFSSDEYKKDFGWIDQVAEIKDPKIIEGLNAKLLENIKNKSIETTWMAVPEIIEWENSGGFRYSTEDGDSELHEDIFLPDFLGTITGGEEIDLEALKSETVYEISLEDERVVNQWRVFDCIYSEQRDEGLKKTFLLSNGRWYEIAQDFAEEVTNDFIKIRNKACKISFCDCKAEKEGDYNERVAKESSYCLMDKKLIRHGGGYSEIEFCDLFTKDKKIVHVKHYGGSSVLSHLFFQGLVSGETFLRDKKFREKVNSKLEDGFKLSDTVKRPNPADYEIVFGVISASSKPLELPFFSKVSLRNAVNRLETFGYPVSLVKIQNKSE